MKRIRMGVILTGGLLLAAPGLAAAFTAASGAVTDERTGLVWQQQDDGQGKTWEAAIAYCEGLSLAGQGDIGRLLFTFTAPATRGLSISTMAATTVAIRVTAPTMFVVFAADSESVIWRFDYLCFCNSSPQESGVGCIYDMMGFFPGSHVPQVSEDCGGTPPGLRRRLACRPDEFAVQWSK